MAKDNRGGKRNAGTQSVESFIKDMVDNYNEFTRGDLQGAVEAYAEQNNLDSNKLLEKIDKEAQEDIRLNNQTRMNSIKQTKELLTRAKAQETKAEKEYRKASGGVLMAQTEEVAERERAKREKAWDKYMKARIKRSNLEIDLDRKVREYRGLNRIRPRRTNVNR